MCSKHFSLNFASAFITAYEREKNGEDGSTRTSAVADEAADVMLTTLASAADSITQFVRALNDKLWWRSRVLILALFVGLSCGVVASRVARIHSVSSDSSRP